MNILLLNLIYIMNYDFWKILLRLGIVLLFIYIVALIFLLSMWENRMLKESTIQEKTNIYMSNEKTPVI